MKKKNIICLLITVLTLLAGSLTYIYIYIYNTSGEKQNNNTTASWEKYSKDPILGDATTGSLFDPFCIIDKRYSEKYRCYISKRNEASIVLYTSNDGIHFNNDYITIIKSDQPNTIIYNRPNIVEVDGVYYMYFTRQIDWQISEIYRGYSTDGLHFTFDNEPVLTATLEFEKQSVMNPNVIFDKDTNEYRMYYAAGETVEPDVIGLATSQDGIHWQKRKEPVLTKNPDQNALDSFKVGATDIKVIDGKFYVFYIGYTDINTGRIFLTKSEDGIVFDRSYLKLIAEPDKDGFDKESVYKPSALYDADNNRWLLYYNGRTSDREYIGLYIKNGENLE